MKCKNFEEYLQDRFMDENPQVLDDDYPDAFDTWLSDLDIDTWIQLGDAYGKSVGIVRDEQAIDRIYKYKNPDTRCKYPFEPNYPVDYCWGYANSVDKKWTKEYQKKICKSCEMWKEIK